MEGQPELVQKVKTALNSRGATTIRGYARVFKNLDWQGDKKLNCDDLVLKGTGGGEFQKNRPKSRSKCLDLRSSKTANSFELFCDYGLIFMDCNIPLTSNPKVALSVT